MYDTTKINAAMGAKRLTNEQVAEKTDLNPATISRIRNGALNVSLSNLIAVADALGLTMQDLFTPKAEETEKAA